MHFFSLMLFLLRLHIAAAQCLYYRPFFPDPPGPTSYRLKTGREQSFLDAQKVEEEFTETG